MPTTPPPPVPGQGQRGIEESGAGERAHQPELDHRHRTDSRAHRHLVGYAGGAGLRRSGYRAGDDPRARHHVCRSDAIQRRSPAFTQTKPGQQQRHPQRDVNPGRWQYLPGKGRLALTEVAVDESTGSVTLRAIFPNPQHVLLPGMFVRARIDEGIMNDAILAPQQGITRDAKGDATALVVDAANKVEQRTVETGDTYGDKWLVLSGLKAGDKLIVEGTSKVAPGQTVKAVAVNNNGGNA
ncbi:efflux RND transporter periplasmic adaptor subunit [Klebsiella variicola subsp. variicola]|nr:efflux RND transporter periplasmic adaptor subunit [Klebsiella variicola subsp. variicola]